MGIKHLLLLFIYLDPLNVLCAAAQNVKKSKPPPKRNQRNQMTGNGTAVPAAAPGAPPGSGGGGGPGRGGRGGGGGITTQVQAPPAGLQHDTCLGYYDVSGALDKEFSCNNTDHRYCCGSCFLRFCCADKSKRVEQKACTNYNTPDWIKTQPPSPAPSGQTYDPALDQTNATVYITCGVVSVIALIGILAKVAYDKATKPPQEMNVHRALADIMRQQAQPSSQYEHEHEHITSMESSPKEETPVRASKNHYTPVHSKASNHGHYMKENFMRSQSQDIHNYISSGYVTLGRGHLKAQLSVDDLGQMSWEGDLDIPISYSNPQQDYQRSHMDLTALTPKIERPHHNILTAATEPYRTGEPYDLSLSRSFQNLSHLPPSYELAMKPELNDKNADDYYGGGRKHHHRDFQGATHMVKLSAASPQHQHQHQHQPRSREEPPQQRQQRRPRVQRAMSQDHVLSPPRTPRRSAGGDRDRDRDHYGLSSYGGMAAAAYGSSRHLSEEQLLSADRLRSQDPLLSPAMRRDKFREKAMARAMSQADMLMPTTPKVDRHKMTKMHSHPSSSSPNDGYKLQVNHHQGQGGGGGGGGGRDKRQAFAGRRTHTVDLNYIPGHHHDRDHHDRDHHGNYRTASKNEVTV